jgi:hypothetical protein
MTLLAAFPVASVTLAVSAANRKPNGAVSVVDPTVCVADPLTAIVYAPAELGAGDGEAVGATVGAGVGVAALCSCAVYTSCDVAELDEAVTLHVPYAP